jgi:hypothetical protein
MFKYLKTEMNMLNYILLLRITTNRYMLLYAIALDVHKAS